MYDTWIKSVDAGKLVGVCLLDMSAAFDLVDHDLLLRKLRYYGFDEDAVKWLRSYLSDRRQCVSIDGSLSRLEPVPTGVPQGSILGPILYILLTNELPDIVQDQHLLEGTGDAHAHQGPAMADLPSFTMDCEKCGSTCCYADDTTYSYSNKDPEALSCKLSAKYLAMSNFMVNNKLKLNDDKTHLMVLTTSQYRRKTRNLQVEIRTPTETIQPSCSEKLLGGWIHQDMKWSEHLLNNETSLVRSLTTRLAALKKVGKLAGFKNRKMIANGLIMSKLSYLIPLWAGCETYIMQALQKIQTRAARVVTRSSLPTSEQLAQCGWLSVQQLAIYQTCILVHKVLANKEPQYIFNMFSTDYRRETRQAARMEIKQDREHPALELTKDSFRCRATRDYNRLPVDQRNQESLRIFMTNLWKWITINIPIG